jgi:biopolymer transport protein ExbD
MISLDPGSEESAAPVLLSEINVTPFIDVMLVVLVIFMVAAPLMMVGVPLSLPKVAAQALAVQRKPVIVSLDKDGKLYIADDQVPVEQLTARLQAMTKDNADLIVYVRGDRGVDYGRVVDLLAKIGAAGVAHVSLVAQGQTLPGVTPQR